MALLLLLVVAMAANLLDFEVSLGRGKSGPAEKVLHALDLVLPAGKNEWNTLEVRKSTGWFR